MGGFTMLNRRHFLKLVAVTGGGLYSLSTHALSNIEKLTVFHTNDMHCNFEPFSDNDPKFSGRE